MMAHEARTGNVGSPPTPVSDHPQLSVDEAGVAAELKALPRWVAWTLVPRPHGKPAKVPLCPRTGRPAVVTDPRQFVAFDDAIGFYRDRQAAGVGFGLFPADRITAADFDHCRDPETGAIDPFVAAAVAELDSYAEVPPSGTVVRAFGIGNLDAAGRRRAGGVELYDGARFVTVTGHRLPSARATVEPCEALLRRLQAALGPPQNPPVVRPAAGGFCGDDAQLLARAFAASNGPRLRVLWDGRHD